MMAICEGEEEWEFSREERRAGVMLLGCSIFGAVAVSVMLLDIVECGS